MDAPVPAAASWSVYLLLCADGTLYAGATNGIQKRLAAHARGAVKYTRGRLPVELAYLEDVGGRGAALSREAAIKRLGRKAKDGLCRQMSFSKNLAPPRAPRSAALDPVAAPAAPSSKKGLSLSRRRRG